MKQVLREGNQKGTIVRVGSGENELFTSLSEIGGKVVKKGDDKEK